MAEGVPRRVGSLLARLLVLRALGMLLSLVALALLARTLGPPAYGSLMTALAYTQLVGALTDLGYSRALVSRYPGVVNPARGRACSEATLVGLVAGPVVAGATFLLLGRSGRDATSLSSIEHWAILGGCIGLATEFCATPYVADHLARERLWPVAVAELAMRGSNLVVAALATFGVLSFSSAALLYGLAPALRLPVLMMTNDQPLFRPRRPGATTTRLLRQAVPLAGAAVLGQLLLRLDQIVVANVAGREAAGYYAASYRVLVLMLIPITILSQIVFSRASQQAASDWHGRSTSMVVKVSVSIAVISAVVAACSDLLIRLLFGPEYRPAGEMLRFLVFSAVPTSAAYILGSILTARGRPGILFMATAFGLVANALALAVLVPQAGAVGAAAALLISESVSLGLLVVAVRVRSPRGVASAVD